MTSRLVERWQQVTSVDAAKVAIDDDHESVSFETLGARASAVSAALRGRGLEGQRVAMLVTQSSGWVEAFFGTVLSGAVVVPLSPLHPEAEQRWFVENSRSKAIIVSRDLERRVSGYAGDRPVLEIEELRQFPTAHVSPGSDDDTAVILYTSGTTGKPKGALITHANLAELARLVASAWQWSPDDVLLHSLPLHHLHGLGISLFVSLLAGGRTRMIQKFDAPRMWDLMAEATVLMGVPTMHKKLLDALDTAEAADRDRWQKNAGGLRLVTSGSAALPSTVGERWRELTGAYPLERFGMTEIGVGMTNPVSGKRVPGTCGPPLPGMDIRVVREDGDDAAPGEPGEIWIRGPSVFKGYDGQQDVTRRSFTDGWFRSGDTATWTEDGYVKILGRTSVDILKSGGYKLSALEIEEVLREHSAVNDVAVVGVPDETWGEIAVAAVISRAGRESEVEEAPLRQWAKQHIAAYKVPKRVLLFEDFPRNPVGKVIKPELVKLVRRRLETAGY